MPSSTLANLRPSLLATGLCALALAVPVVATFALPSAWTGFAGLLWLTILVPVAWSAHLFGWRGAAVAMAGCMGLVLVVHLGLSSLEREPSPTLSWGIPLVLLLGGGVAWASTRRDGPAAWDRRRSGPPASDDPRALEIAFEAAQEGQLLSAAVFELEGLEALADSGSEGARGAALEMLRDIVGPGVATSPAHAPRAGVFALVRGADEAGAGGFAERVRSAFEASLPPEWGRLSVRAGIAAFRPAMGQPDDLVAAANLALERAREGGAGAIRVFGRPASHPPSGQEGLGGGASTAGRPGRGRGTAGTRSHADPAAWAPTIAAALPAPRPGATGPDAAPARRSLGGEGRRVLLVDDETPVRTLVSTHLQKLGFVVEEGRDALQGARALAAEFDVVITDLPSGDGPDVDLVTATKARWPDTPVVAITGFGDARLAADALHAGADRYLFKPFGMAELEGHLAELLAARDARLEARRARRTRAGPARSRHGADAAVLDGARALARAVEIRDPFTRGHAERVRKYAGILLEALAETGDHRGIDGARLRLACELYDVGKLGVSEAVLNKGDRLTDEEYRQVRAHPRIGRDILSRILDDELVLAVTAWHHERWDGEGYPDALVGEAIPLPARIVAIADSLDAMTSPRAYRAGLEWDDAVGQIRARAGTQFDPGLLPVFEAALPQLARIHASADFPDRSGEEASGGESGPESNTGDAP